MIERIRYGRTDLVFEHLAAGRPATACDEHGTSLIEWCAYHGDVSAVRALVANGERLETLGPNLDLNGVAFHGHWQLCQYLLEHGADPNFELPETGETPLHAATSKANRPAYDHVVQVLLAYGADPGRAARAGAPTAAFMRDARTRGETPLHRAAAFGGERTIRMLLEAGARLDARDANGDTPLAWASWHLRPAAVLRLLCYGPFRIHPDNDSNYDHGAGWGSMDSHARGRPGGGPSGRGASSSRA